jgi:hypothetical protein
VADQVGDRLGTLREVGGLHGCIDLARPCHEVEVVTGSEEWSEVRAEVHVVGGHVDDRT